MKVLTFTGIFRKEGKEYSAFCPEFEVASCGNSIEEAQKNLTEAVESYLESAKDLGILPDILRGTLRDILRKAGISRERFF